MKLNLGILAWDIAIYKSYVFYSGRIKTLVAMATYSFHRLIMGKVEIGNFYCLIRDNRILFLQKGLSNSSPHFIRLLLESLNLIGSRGNINRSFSKKVCFSRTISRLKVMYMFMVLATSLVVLYYCCATAEILTKILQQCFLFFIVVVIPGQ